MRTGWCHGVNPGFVVYAIRPDATHPATRRDAGAAASTSPTPAWTPLHSAPVREPSPSTPDDDALLLPRGLIFLASMWLIASWISSIGLRPPVQPSAPSYTPAVRLMIFLVSLGLLIVWPLMRLSEPPARWGVRRTLLDLVVLLSLTQVVVWPLRLVTAWSTGRTLLIDLTIVAWTGMIAAIVAVTLMREHASRWFAMALCLALCIGGPAALWILRPIAPALAGDLTASTVERFGALTSIHRLTGGEPGPVGVTEWRYLAVLGGAALAAWVAVAVLAILGRSGSPAQVQAVS